ncbi:MAG: DUF4147 domain-containing protein [Desulfovibrionaceae bacterium]|nr:DUF4147 domain-containing protein [Desulfovibrionaceae bacterium]
MADQNHAANSFTQTERTRLRDLLLRLNSAALAAVAPDGAVLRHLALDGSRLSLLDDSGSAEAWSADLNDFRRVLVLGAGKGAAPMALALEELLGDHVDDGLVIVKYDHDLPVGHRTRRIRVLEGAHPVPDRAGMEAAAQLVDMAEACTERDLALCVFTGGASALTPALQPGIGLGDLQELTKLLLQCGATIHEINCLRKHLSRLSGGALARALAPARGLGLIVSDVVGDDLDVIASGPTVPDSSTFADCMDIVTRYRLQGRLPAAVEEHLKKGLAGLIPDTPKAGDPAFARLRNVLVATLGQALQAAAAEAGRLNLRPVILTDSLTGEARVRAGELMERARAMQREMSPGERPICLLAGGETTVTIRGSGRGGRNQEMALAASLALAQDTGIAALFAGTDGTDGPTDAAGGFAFAGDALAWPEMGIDARAMLDMNDSYACLDRAGTLFKSGPTRTNVMDAAIIVIQPVQG